jgi:hypothetical protein
LGSIIEAPIFHGDYINQRVNRQRFDQVPDQSGLSFPTDRAVIVSVEMKTEGRKVRSAGCGVNQNRPD